MDVAAKIANGDYKPTVEYPARPKKPVLGRHPMAEEARTYADAVEAFPALQDAWKVAVGEYHANVNAKEAQLRRDLEAENGMTGHPKADKVWNKAWEHGHSAGYSEVSYWYDEFAEVAL